MKKLFLIVMMLLSFFVVTACQSSEETTNVKDNAQKDQDGNELITIEVFTNDSSAPTRVTNFDAAAKKLNEELESEGADYRVEIEAIVKPMGGEEADQNFIFAAQSGNSADIYTTSYGDIGWMADGDYILPVDELKEEEVFKNQMEGYWDPVTWKGTTFGVIQDTEARVVYFNKQVLRKMGWSEEEINQLPEQALSGEFTIDDMTELAAEAKNQGFVKNGYEFDGGSNDNPMNFYNFGSELYDWGKNTFILDKEKMTDTFEWLKENVNKGVIPTENMNVDKSEKLARMLNEETLFAQGGIWDEAKFRNQGWHKELGNVTTDWTKENVGVMNLPVVEKGNKPVTVSNPWVYVISKNTEHPDIAKHLLAYVSSPEIQAIHAVETSHIPFTKEGQESEQVLANEWINSVKHFTNYSRFNGNHPDQSKYDKILKDATNYVMTGEMSPQEAVAYMEQQMELNLKSNDFIIK